MSLAVRRLLPLFTPKHYSLRLDVRQTTAFRGSVEIIGTLPKNVSSITLHAKDLIITKAFINEQPVTWQYGENDELTLLADVQAGTHTLKLQFQGVITEPMRGLYPCYFTHNGEQKIILATQFQSHSAREVFPCIDEPAAKAIFELSLLTAKDLTVLSNTPVAHQIKNKFLVTTFSPTPPMSTYLLAFVVGELASLQTTSKNGVTVRTFSTPDHIEQTRYALELAAKLLDFNDEFFGMPYPLPKCDLVALPDFSAGAMENWGLIAFRESCMFVDPQHTSLSTKQLVANVVAHELAHQWFGNLVTMEWWDDLWLNESFANWMPYYVLDKFYPDWQLWNQFSTHEQQRAFGRDSLEHVQAVRQPLSDPEEINSIFDPAIVYAKGSCLVRMAHQFVGDKKFRTGLQTYIKRHAYGNATMDDLWQALGIRDFMLPWVSQPGHPVVTFHQGILHQRRFFAHPNLARDEHESLWPIPLKRTRFSTRSTQTKQTYINQDGDSFYHVHYDIETLATLNIAKQPLLFKQKLLQDELALVAAGLETSTTLLRLLEQYKNETDYSVWLVIQTVLHAFRRTFGPSPELQNFTSTLCQPEFERLGWHEKPTDTHFDTLLRPLLVELLIMANDPPVTSQAHSSFAAASTYKDLPASIRQSVYSTVANTGSKMAFQKLLDWRASCQSADERMSMSAGLAQTQNATRIEQVIGLFVHTKPQDTPYFFAHLMRNFAAQEKAWQWMLEHWGWIKKAYSGDFHYDSFIRYSGAALNTAHQLQEFKRFFEPKRSEPGLARIINQTIEDIDIRRLWRKRDAEAVLGYLKARAAKP